MPLVQYPAPQPVDDPCATCPHAWHGLPCRRPVSPVNDTACGCPGPWASEAPAE